MAADMNCPKCKTINQVGAKFCRGCGAALPGAAPARPPQAVGASNVCSRCSATNLRSAQVCSNCGAALGSEAPKKAGPPPAADKTVLYSPGGAEKVFKLVRRDLDGVQQEEYVLGEGRTIIGRSEGDITCPADAKMSRRHAEVRQEGGRVLVTDLQSTNGVYRRIETAHKLAWGDVILVGSELLRFDPAGGPAAEPAGAGANPDKTLCFGETVKSGEFALVDPTGKILRKIPVEKFPVVIGRGAVEISFPDDTGLEARHAQVLERGDGLYLVDMGTVRGVFLRILAETELAEGDQFLTGEQIFELDKSGG